MTTSDTTVELIDRALSADLSSAALGLARRFQHGATLWVVSPQWEPHAHHVAVEFVHPVIMGKRALPSVSLVEPDPVAQCRVATRPGDVILAVASADQPQVRDIMNEEFESMLAGKQDAKAALDKAVQRGNAAIQQAIGK